MKHFILFFEEKEGSTAVIQTLASLGSISVVRRETENDLGGWEPFEWFNCGSLGKREFRECLNLIFGARPVDLSKLNGIYMRTARARLRDFDGNRSVGFKMRIVPPWDLPHLSADSQLRKNRAVDVLARALRRVGRDSFRRLMAETLPTLNVVVFIMVRQDVFRWAISKYHGDGTGRPGHMQFRMALTDGQPAPLPKITIDPARFGRLVEKCIALHRTKRWWCEAMQSAGLSVHPLRYEDFVGDRAKFFGDAIQHLCIPVSQQINSDLVADGTRLKRVHGSVISDYVVNHRQITDLYGDSYVSW